MNNIAPTDLISAETEQVDYTRCVSRSAPRLQCDRFYQYGDLDGLLGNEPDKKLWQNNPEYKQGYLNGTSRRIDNQFNGLEAA